MKTKNILELCLSPSLGGLELCVKDSYEYFKLQTTTYICVAPDKPLDKSLDDNNKFLLKRNKFFPIIPALKLSKFIDEKCIDLVHFHWTRDIATVVLAKVLSKQKPKLVQSRHMRMTRFKDDFYHKWLYKNLDMMHAVTKDVSQQLKRFIPEDVRPKIEMVYLGVKEPIINQNKMKELKQKYHLKNEFVVGIVGRIEEGKGQHIVIEAISKLKGLDIKVLIVGNAMSDDYLQHIKQVSKDLNVEDKIVFTGFTKEVPEHIQLCDIMVLATVEETFGLVVIEAMANKKCILAVNKGGPLEIIKDGIDGILFEREAEALKEYIYNLYHNNILKEHLALKGFEKFKDNFEIDTQMKLLYKTII